MFSAWFDNAYDAILALDWDGRLVAVNRALCETLGHLRADLLQMRMQDITPPELASSLLGRMKRLNSAGHLVFEGALLRRDRTRVPVELAAHSIAFAPGKSVILAIARDLSRHEPVALNARQSERHTQALLNATAEAALLIEPDGTIEALNQACAETLHGTISQLVGTNFYDDLPADCAANQYNQVRDAVHTQHPVHYEEIREGRRFSITYYPILDSQGTVSRIAVYASDITQESERRVLDNLLHAVDQRILKGVELSEGLNFVCSELARVFGYGCIWIGRRETDGTFKMLASAGEAEEFCQALTRIGVRWDDTPEGHGVAGSAIRTGDVQVLHALDSSFGPWQQAATEYGIASAMGIPLILRGQIFGAFCIHSSADHAFDDIRVVDNMRSVATRVSVALEIALDQQQLRLLRGALGAAANAVFITDRSGRVEWANDAFARQSGYALSEILGQNPRFLRSGHHGEPYYRDLWGTILAGRVWANETVERHKSGRLYTVRQTITPVADPSGEIAHFIAIHEDISSQKETESLVRQAHHDPLTELPNRRLLLEEMTKIFAAATRHQGRAAVMYLDLDGFKAINDRFGHEAGDEVLKEAARRLTRCVRAMDVVARLGGDEFVIVLAEVASDGDTEAVAKKALALLGEPMTVPGQALSVSASMGISVFPSHGKDAATLLRHADEALYQAKQSGKNRYAVYAA
ncbi:MAG: diguanylate cyclase [Betaproteobacteria bacterium]|nr:diguanylate cyclase [Betaproteobacteria bacterium]